MRGKGNIKVGIAQTINGSIVTDVALDKNGIPMLGDKLSFLTVGKESGSIKQRGKTRVNE